MDDEDLPFMTGWDFRNSTATGLSLFLASPFQTEGIYKQACGRVLRGHDEGRIYTLPRRMWQK
jgi:hypothetical protein